MEAKSIKIGVIAELTGPLSFMGIANANLMTMLVDDLNAKGGFLGRRVDLIVEDGETADGVAKAKTAKLVDEDNVDVVIGGIYSSTRQATHRALSPHYMSGFERQQIDRERPRLVQRGPFIFPRLFRIRAPSMHSALEDA